MNGKKIIFICSRLDTPGGIERAVINTANLFAAKGNKVELLIADIHGSPGTCYSLDPAVKKTHLPLSFGIGIPGNGISRKWQLYRDVKTLKKVFVDSAPDVVIGTEYPFSIAAVLTGLGKKIRLMAWEHQHHEWVKKSAFWNWLMRKTYPKLYRVVCLNRTEAEHYRTFAPASLIPNFIEEIHLDHRSADHSQLLTVGWLIPRKGTDLLLPVAKEVLNRFPSYTWKLVGDGELKELAAEFIKKEHLEGCLLLQAPGKEEMDTVYRGAGLFVLPSRFEAFPMVLLEALTYGIPCISFDCPTGPSSIITSDEDGILVKPEDIAAMTAAISGLLDDQARRQQMSALAFKNIRRFDKEFIYPMWATLLNAPLHT